ncbi:MAG: hypothetical protein L6R30_01225 [Thermoanaerobaculia bacterium]|nr:hypothetical protein [Thermoanaerobaculia bacterium]
MLEIVVLHDYSGQPDQHLANLSREKLIRERQIPHYGPFRRGSARATGSYDGRATHIEDLVTPSLYVDLYGAAFRAELTAKAVKEIDRPPGDRIVDRLSRYADVNGLKLRAAGGFSHNRFANRLASHPIALDDATLDRFEALFKDGNERFTTS